MESVWSLFAMFLGANVKYATKHNGQKRKTVKGIFMQWYKVTFVKAYRFCLIIYLFYVHSE